MIALKYFNGKDYIDSGTRFTHYSSKVPHSLISPYPTKINTQTGNQIITGRACHDLVECLCEYERYDGLSLVAGSFVQKSNGVKILIGGEHANARIINTTFSTCPVFQAETLLTGNLAALASRSKGAVTIGNGAVIGENSLILSGVTIGNGAVIGAGSVVTKDVPPFAIAAGNPAKVMKFRFENDVISKLERIRWWDFDYEFMRKHIKELLSSKTDEFFSCFGKAANNRHVEVTSFFVVLEFAPPASYTIKGVEYKGRFYELDKVPEIRDYFDQIKALPNQNTITVDPYLYRYLRK